MEGKNISMPQHATDAKNASFTLTEEVKILQT